MPISITLSTIEEVVLKIAPTDAKNNPITTPAEWVITSGGGALTTAADGLSATFIAPKVPESAGSVVTVTDGGVSDTATIVTISAPIVSLGLSAETPIAQP